MLIFFLLPFSPCLPILSNCHPYQNGFIAILPNFLFLPYSQFSTLHLSNRTQTRREEVDELTRTVAELLNRARHFERQLEETGMRQENQIRDLTFRLAVNYAFEFSTKRMIALY